eukprot:PITA_35845
MVEEYDSIMWNSVWDVIPRPGDKSMVSSRWLYKVKRVADGSVEKQKERFVARGFSQVEGIDYAETFAPIARYSSIRSMLALSAQMGWKIHQMDVKTTFPNGKIEGEVYIEQPKGFETFDHELHVFRLKRLIKSCKEDLVREFEMKDMGLMHYFLGMEVWQKDGEVFGSHGKYANEILKHFHMEKCKPMQTPLARNWRKEDATSDWAGSPSDRKSTSIGIFNLGLAAVSWYGKKQRSVALSSVEAKYMATSQVACEAIWMQMILVGLFGELMDPTVIYCDNQSCIKLSENPVFHDRSKHIDIR